jgi:nucleotide-binding universal stress UspA family protein
MNEQMALMVCYDESEASQTALALSVSRAQRFQAKLFIVRSMQTGSNIQLGDITTVEETLQAKASLVKETGISCEPHLLTRGLEPGEDLVQFALEKSVGEIVIGIKKKSRLEKVLVGSTAQYVILHATCPVVTTK